MAIPYAVTRSAIFFAAATLLLCSGYCCSIIGQCARHKGLYTFISGIVFIVTGLVMLFGLIVYIAIFKSEVGSKLRPRSQLQPPAFDYWYGYSFLLYVSGFISTQFAGVSAIFLFIYKMQYDWESKHLEDIRKGAMRPQHPVNFVHFDHTMFYPCRRHPQAYINSNSAIHLSYPSPSCHKRYFFGKDPVHESPCGFHRPHSHSNSLKDLSSFYDFPPPPTISYQFEERRQFPRDATATTVSTTADVICDEFLPGGTFDDYSPSIQHEHEFVTFDLDRPMPLRAQSSLSISSRNGTGKKGTDSDPMRRTTPV